MAIAVARLGGPRAFGDFGDEGVVEGAGSVAAELSLSLSLSASSSGGEYAAWCVFPDGFSAAKIPAPMQTAHSEANFLCGHSTPMRSTRSYLVTSFSDTRLLDSSTDPDSCLTTSPKDSGDSGGSPSALGSTWGGSVVATPKGTSGTIGSSVSRGFRSAGSKGFEITAGTLGPAAGLTSAMASSPRWP